jgi:hypothetical protein
MPVPAIAPAAAASLSNQAASSTPLQISTSAMQPRPEVAPLFASPAATPATSSVVPPQHLRQPLPQSSSAPTVQLVDCILEAPADALPGPILLLYDVPAAISLSVLGSELCVFGRLSIKLVLTTSHGMTAVVQYSSVNSAVEAVAAMRGRSYELTAAGRPSAVWTIHPHQLVYARCPLAILAAPHVTLKVRPRD